MRFWKDRSTLNYTYDVDIFSQKASRGSAPGNQHAGNFGPLSGFGVEFLHELDAIAVLENSSPAYVETACKDF